MDLGCRASYYLCHKLMAFNRRSTQPPNFRTPENNMCRHSNDGIPPSTPETQLPRSETSSKSHPNTSNISGSTAHDTAARDAHLPHVAQRSVGEPLSRHGNTNASCSCHDCMSAYPNLCKVNYSSELLRLFAIYHESSRCTTYATLLSI
jgi:hypothetical protein